MRTRPVDAWGGRRDTAPLPTVTPTNPPGSADAELGRTPSALTRSRDLTKSCVVQAFRPASEADQKVRTTYWPAPCLRTSVDERAASPNLRGVSCADQ